MQVSDVIVGKQRNAGSKGTARKLRASGFVPGVVYGPGSEPFYIALDPKPFIAQRKQYGRGHMFTVEAEGQAPFKAFLKEIQRHPVSGSPVHVDLYKVDMNRPIRVSVRIELVGKPVGIIAGGMLSQTLHRIELKGLPALIPEFVQADVSQLNIGDSLHISALALPEGVRPTLHHDEAIALVAEPQAAAEEAKPAAAAEGAAAAPAAAGGAAAKAAPAKAAPAKK